MTVALRAVLVPNREQRTFAVWPHALNRAIKERLAKKFQTGTKDVVAG